MHTRDRHGSPGSLQEFHGHHGAVDGGRTDVTARGRPVVGEDVIAHVVVGGRSGPHG